jgi:deazaflavin-dependent oxidoreductase (nitroreductase family)
VGRSLGVNDPGLAELDYAYLTTTGRASGRPHRIEIWFAMYEGIVYLLAGGRDRSDWVRNLLACAKVTIEIGDRTRDARARVIEPGSTEDSLARRLLLDKYAPGDPSGLAAWGTTALAIAVEPTER